jgi:hypothetical protein
MTTNYYYSFQIHNNDGSTMTFNFTCDTDTSARLKAKWLAKKRNGKVGKFKKETIPYEIKGDEQKKKMQEAIMAR